MSMADVASAFGGQASTVPTIAQPDAGGVIARNIARNDAGDSDVARTDGIYLVEAVDKILGGNRTVEQIAKDGARVTISQIDKLRNALREAERCCQHLIATGQERHDDAKVWKRVAKAADKLLDGML